MLYGTQCQAVKNQHENKVSLAEVRMLRWMCGKTRWDKIRNDTFERRPVDVVRRVDQMEDSQITRGRERPRKTIRESEKLLGKI